MELPAALRLIRERRGPRDVVLTTMGAAREWMRLGPLHPLDWIYAPSAMGQLPALALGMAIAQPDRRVIAVNGDGCMLMNLGVLVTISAAAPENLLLIVCDNGVYEVTGQQLTPASPAARRGGRVDYEQIARGSGWSRTWSFQELDDWEREFATVMSARGPSFVSLRVAPIPGGTVPVSPAPAPARAAALLEALTNPAVC